MTQEEKELLLKDLCARLPYHPILHYIDSVQPQDDEYLYGFRENADKFLINDAFYIEEVVPYLRPMSSMTEEEMFNFHKNGGTLTHYFKYDIDLNSLTVSAIDWLNAHHFDYRGLIEKGLALEAPEDMYNSL